MFNIDDFDVSTLTAAIEDIPYVPGRIGSLGWFQAEGIQTTTVQIERRDKKLSLVPTAPRGGVAKVAERSLGTLVPINTVHLPQRRAIIADELQNARAFGSEDATKAAMQVIANYQATMRRNIDATFEHMRIGAVKGQVIDADGSTVLADFFNTFGLSKSTKDINLGSAATKMLKACMELHDMVEDKLGGKSFTGVRVICGRTFFQNLVENAAVKESYKEYMGSEMLRKDSRGGFVFGDIIWEQYRGTVNGQKFVEDNKAYLVPEGVSDMFLARFAPADYNETVNTMGLPYYSKMWALQGDKGYELETQSNPIFINTDPSAVIELTDTTS